MNNLKAENWFWIGASIKAVLFLIYSEFLGHDSLAITIPDGKFVFPYFSMVLAFIVLDFFLWILYLFLRNKFSRTLPENLIFFQFVILLIAALLYISQNHIIAAQALEQVIFSEKRIFFPFENVIEMIWESILGKAFLILSAIGVFLLPVNLFIMFNRK